MQWLRSAFSLVQNPCRLLAGKYLYLYFFSLDILYFVFLTQISCLPRPRLSSVRRCTDGAGSSQLPAVRRSTQLPGVHCWQYFSSNTICICLNWSAVFVSRHTSFVWWHWFAISTLWTASVTCAFTDSCDLWYLVLLAMDSLYISVTSYPRLSNVNTVKSDFYLLTYDPWPSVIPCLCYQLHFWRQLL